MKRHATSTRARPAMIALSLSTGLIIYFVMVYVLSLIYHINLNTPPASTASATLEATPDIQAELPRVTDPPSGRNPAPDLPREADPDWWQATHQSLSAREYHLSETDAGLQAPNRAQGFRTHFRGPGISVGPRDVRTAAWRVGWTTTSWGRETALRPVEPARTTVNGNRVEYTRDHMVEWYENGSEGLEQGFTIPISPVGEGRLCIEGTLEGDARARSVTTPNGAAIDFIDPQGARVLRYTGLHVWDAEGRDLPGEMTLRDATVHLLIDDRDAAYPVFIDPMFRSPDWSAELDSTEAHFGASVSTAGDVNGDGYSDVIIGAPLFDGGSTVEGCAEVYLGSPAGLAVDPDWHHESGLTLAFFGGTVATAGDVNGDGYDDVIVGARGAAFVFLGSSEGLSEDHVWQVTGEHASSGFGGTVHMAGDVNDDGFDDVIVGASGYSGTLADQGKAYVYHGSATGPSNEANWTSVGHALYDGYGFCVASAGDVNGDGIADVIVGSRPNLSETSNPGYVRVYHGSSTGLELTADWTEIGESIYDEYGRTVSMAGDVNGDGYGDVLVGVPYYRHATGDGRVYIFHGSATGIGEGPAGDILACDVANSAFGWATATAGDMNGDGYADIIVGAPSYTEDAPEEREGFAFVYYGSWEGVREEAIYRMEGDQYHAALGSSVATAGDVNGDGFSDVIVGAPYFDNPEENEGCAFVYHGNGLYPRIEPGWVIESNQVEARFGTALAGLGDVNGDGYGDVLVGASAYDAGQPNEGAVFLFLGSRTGLGALPVWFAQGEQADAYLGAAVGAAGDVNGDGYPDGIVGANRYTNTYEDEGAAFIWLSRPGSAPNGTPANADWSVYGRQELARLGFAVSGAGDVNGDGFADVVVGAPYYDRAQTDEGIALVYLGSSTGPSTTAHQLLQENNDYSEYGLSVATAGDFNGDGYSDVLVGAPKYNDPESTEGAVFLYAGSAEGLEGSTPWWHAESNQSGARLGRSVSSAGDANGDGFSDVIAGAPRYDNPPFADGGKAFVWAGQSTPPPIGTPDNAAYDIYLNQEGAWMGYSVASAGDVDGDGYADIIAGGYRYDGGDERIGMVWVVGLSSDWHETFLWWNFGEQIDASWGWAVAGAGDVNGDGLADVLVGAPHFDMGQTNEGRAFLYFGNDSRGLTRRPRQFRSDFSAPIAALGASDSETMFGLAADVRTPLGRGTARMEWEVKPVGLLFDGTGVGSTDWIDTGAPSGPAGSFATTITLIDGLYAGMPYRWRVRSVSDHPFFPRTPWLSIPGNSPMEIDLRMAGDLVGTPVADIAPSAEDRLLGTVAPNPFRSLTTIEYMLPEKAHVRVTIHDVRGRAVKRLVNGVQRAGRSATSWDGRAETGALAASGVYFVRLEWGGRVETTRIVLAR